MSRGKKFDAAEKHFMKKIDSLNRENKALRTLLSQTRKDLSQLKLHADSVSQENQQLRDWVERLLSYTELSKEGIQAACDKDKHMAQAAALISGFAKYF